MVLTQDTSVLVQQVQLKSVDICICSQRFCLYFFFHRKSNIHL